jgi:hypothetical protein
MLSTSMSFDHIFNALTGLCEIAIWWMIWQDYRKDRGKEELQMPAMRWLIMIVLSLGPVGAVIYEKYIPKENHTLREFDTPDGEAVVMSYGLDGPSSCFMTVHGKALALRRSGYKLAIACFIYDGHQDILDVPYLQVSKLYDIKDVDTYIGATFAAYFNIYRSQMHANGINVALLNVPYGVQTSQFTTLRQARALGVLIPVLNTGIAGTLKP